MTGSCSRGSTASRASAPAACSTTRSLSGSGASQRVAGQTALSLDLRGAQVALSDARAFSREPWLGAVHGGADRLTRVPGGGASVDFLDALNPTISGDSIYWLLARSGEHHVAELHRYNRATRRDERVAALDRRRRLGLRLRRGHGLLRDPRDPDRAGLPRAEGLPDGDPPRRRPDVRAGAADQDALS